MTRPKVTLAAYWRALDTANRVVFARNAGLTADYIGQIISGRRRASRHAAIMLVAASSGDIRAYNLRPDLWTYTEIIDTSHVTDLESSDFELEARIELAVKAWTDASGESVAKQRELASEIAHLVRLRDDGVVAYLEARRTHIRLTGE